MQIRDLMTRSGKRRWLLLVVPAAAAAIGAAYAPAPAERYETTATVVVPSFYDNTGPSATALSVASFRSALTSPSVVDAVAEETGLSADEVQRGLTSDGDGTEVVEVVWTDGDADGEEGLIRAAVAAAFDLLAEPRLTAAETEVAGAQARYEAADAAVAAFREETGRLLPDQDYRTLASELSTFRVKLEEARIAVDAAAIARLSDVIEDREEQLAALGMDVVRFERLDDDLSRHQTTLAQAEQRLVEAEARAAAAADASTITFAGTERVTTELPLVQVVSGSAVLGLILALGILSLLELFRPLDRVVEIPEELSDERETVGASS